MVSLENINLPDNSETENEKIQNVEQLGQLHEAVAQLPIKLRQAVVLHYMQHLSISEAAQAASIRQGTFKSRLNRALKALRKEVI
jgi:RNA polymerase sigma-70 factor (ECF subfamily)